jgi:hypothetical protein
MALQVEAEEVLSRARNGSNGQRCCASSYQSRFARLHMPPMPLRLTTLQPQKKKDW